MKEKMNLNKQIKNVNKRKINLIKSENKSK